MSGCDAFGFEEAKDEFLFIGGLKGADGVTYFPHVSADGVLSWTNDGGKPNPDPVNIKGADGTPGKSAYAAAQEAGFTGTEAEFNTYLSGIGVLTQEVADQKSAIDGKQDAPADSGTAGQVLGLDDDLNPVWLDQDGGGGGTTNYNNLTNKPRINGVLLSGDKSAADLGLVAASDIPTIPVQSVNGKTGAVVLDASDVGAVAEPQAAGTAGQVLRLDSNLNPVWGNQSGGGGTENYNDLSNKPSIEGVTLSGNKTAAELGLAKASDIPAVPVQSVNGKTGAVVLDASDVGALPDNTVIPRKTSDLANDSGFITASALPTRTSDLINNSGFVDAAGAAAAAPVQSVNGSTGAVTAQPPITSSGILKGNGSGGVSAAVAGTDYLTPATNYSPLVRVEGGTVRVLTSADVGKTFWEQWTPTIQNEYITCELTEENSVNMPLGAEIAFLALFSKEVRIKFTNIRAYHSELGFFNKGNGHTITVKAAPCNLVAMKKIDRTYGTATDVWLLTGNVEVVS